MLNVEFFFLYCSINKNWFIDHNPKEQIVSINDWFRYLSETKMFLINNDDRHEKALKLQF